MHECTDCGATSVPLAYLRHDLTLCEPCADKRYGPATILLTFEVSHA